MVFLKSLPITGMKNSSDKSLVRRHDTAKQINTDAVSSSSSFTDSDSTCSMLTPSLEFPDRISFRKIDLSEAGPSGVVVDSNSTDQEITELMPPVRRGDKTTQSSAKQLITIIESFESSFQLSGPSGTKLLMCRGIAANLATMIENVQPIITDILYSGVKVSEHSQVQLRMFFETLDKCKKLTDKVLKCNRWNMVRQLYHVKKMEDLEKKISKFIEGLSLLFLAHVHHLRVDTDVRLDRVDRHCDCLNEKLGSMKIRGSESRREALKTAETTMEMVTIGDLGNLGVGLELRKWKVKDMLFESNDEARLIGISGMSGSGKTTLAREIESDQEVRGHFGNRVLFLIVSQSPNVEELRSLIWGFVSGYDASFDATSGDQTRKLVILDDVWTRESLDQLFFKIPRTTTLVVSRSKLAGPRTTYDVELLNENEATSLFCLSAFDQKSVPLGFSRSLVKQVVRECKGLPLSLKVVGASLKNQPEKSWEGAVTRLSRGEPADETHESRVCAQIEATLENLDPKTRGGTSGVDNLDSKKLSCSSVVVVDSNSTDQEITELMPPVRRGDKTTGKQIYTDAVSSSSSFADSDSTCSMMTPSLEFPDRISFREMDLSEAGPSGVIVNSNSTNRDITKFVPPVRRGDKTTPVRRLERGDAATHINYDKASSSCPSAKDLYGPTSSLMTRFRIGIKGVLKPPPSMKRPPIQGSMGHFLRLHATKSKTVRRPSSSSSFENGCDEEEAGDEKDGNEERGDMFNQLGDIAYDEACSFPWQKGQLLGRGSFGSVYEGISEDGEFFAVKEVSLLEQGSQAQECLKRLEGEIALLSELQHQNIVRYRGTAKDGSNLYIFFELVSQGSLLKLYQRYQLRNSLASMYTRQILDGLKYLHDKCVIHRDIRCANILVDTNGSVKLADFGLAKVSKFNDLKSCKGTPHWMAPEVINPKRNDGYGSPADIWSLGCTVLEMLTGQIPYGNLEPFQALYRIGRGTLPDIPDTLSLDARNFVIECLKVNPEERPTAAELLNHPFVRRPLPSMGSGGLVLASPLLHRQG